MAITNYKLNDARMFADVADNLAIIIDASSGIYFGMNGYGTGIFKNLLDGSSVDDVVAAAQQLPGAPEDVATSIQAFIETLLGFDIILPADAERTRDTKVYEERLHQQGRAADDGDKGRVDALEHHIVGQAHERRDHTKHHRDAQRDHRKLQRKAQTLQQQGQGFLEQPEEAHLLVPFGIT